MINKIKYHLGLTDQITIIGVVNYKNSQEYFYAILEKEKDEIKTLHFRQHLKTLEEFNFLDENLPLIVVYTGHGIVYSQGENSLINNDIDSYYITKYKSDNHDIIAFTRKNQLDNITKYFIEKKYFVVDVVIGVFSINLLQGKVFNRNAIQVADIELLYTNNKFDNFTKKELSLSNTISINDEEKNSLELLSFAIGLNYYYPTNTIKNQFLNDTISHNKIDYNYKKQFDIITKIGAALFLLLLLLNFSIKAYTNSKIKTITSLKSNTSNYQNEFNLLSTEKNKKLAVIQVAGFLNTNYLSYYLNEVGSTTPNNIIIKRINILPINNNITKDKQIQINDRLIKIEGVTNSNKSFNTFLKNLKDKKWIRKIEINNYENIKNNKSNFKLSLTLE